jgi:hypothetical protein
MKKYSIAYYGCEDQYSTPLYFYWLNFKFIFLWQKFEAVII